TSSPFSLVQKRNATHAAAGVANGAKNRPGRRLGLKRGNGEYVTPNTIIFRQRGSKWHPGENAHMGRDHTICASQPGYVRYYRDPAQHPDRKYIGIVFGSQDKLPYPKGMPRRRRLGLTAVPMTEQSAVEEEGAITGLEAGDEATGGKKGTGVTMQKDYSFGLSNYEIGRVAQEAGIEENQFRRSRWIAWRKSAARIARNALQRSARKK
ncbi:hypothetical protein NA57DRAFT_9754, partial [Rhizodiscina lignyota]